MQHPTLDMNKIMELVAEGKLTVDQVNYMLNSAARYTERTEHEHGQSSREVSSPGETYPKLK